MSFIRLLTAALISWAAVAGPGRAHTLADALVAAYHNSGVLDQNRALLRAADEDVAQSLAALRPVISWQASYQWQENTNPFFTTTLTEEITGTFDLSFGLLLYDGGVSETRTEALKEVVLQNRASLLAVEQDVLLRAVTAYMNVRRNTEFVALRQSNVRVIREELRAARDRFEVGEITRTDVSLAEARLAAAESLLAAARGQLAQSVEEYKVAVGSTPEGLGVVSPATLNHDMESARAYAVRNHPNVVAARHGVSAAELSILSAEAALNPTVRLSGNVRVTEQYETRESLGLNVGQTIYQGGQLASQIRQAVARRDASRATLHITSDQVSQNLGNAFALLRVAQASREASEQQTRAARTAFRGVREEATLGARTTLDVLNAEQELLDAQANVISAQADEVIASYQVLAAMGLLTVQHLNLPVQTYDPAAYYNLVEDAPATFSRQGQALDRVLEAIGGN